MKRVRLLPTAIVCAALALMIKLGELWLGLEVVFAPSVAIAADEKSAPKEQAASKETAAGGATQPAGEKPSKPAAADTGGPTAQTPRVGSTKAASFDPAAATDAEIEVLQRLAGRRAELERRARDLDAREALLAATERRLDEKIAEVKKIQETIDALLKRHDEQEDVKFKSLVRIYENMKPKDAARIFEQLDLPILLDVVERMKELKTAPILAAMEPDKAKMLTAALAERRKLPPAGDQIGAPKAQ